MDNRSIANIFYETADLMEVANEDPFRIRSYRRAAEAIEGQPGQIADIIGSDKAVLAIPGVGKGMLLNLKELFAEGQLRLHQQLLKKYQPSMLQLLKISGLGPKTVALIWDAFQVADMAGVEKLAREGKLRGLPRMSAKSEEKILKSIEDFRRISGRYHLDDGDRTAQKIIDHLSGLQGVEKITPAGSLRRGRETVGDLDILVTGKGCCEGARERAAIIERIVNFPGVAEVLARGDNKVSFRMRDGMQVDVRLLPPDSFGAAMQYFTGSKNHNVSLRQRALKLGLTLNEYGLAEVEGGKIVASKTEEEIYRKLKLQYIPPELREDCGEIDAAARNALPELVQQQDIQGDLHMHTVETDGKCTIVEMAEAAREQGYTYMAITDHSKNLAFANGLDDKRAEAHIRRIREVAKKLRGIRVLAGIEVDILGDGELDLSDDVLAQMDIVIGSVHSHFNQEPKKMTDRLLRALENKHVSLLGHPTGRLLLRRDAYAYDIDAVMKAAAKAGVAMEHNGYPDRLDLSDVHLRMAKERGVKIIVNTDAHHTSHLEKMKYGVLQLRRAWLTRSDVLNTLPADQFAKAVKRG